MTMKSAALYLTTAILAGLMVIAVGCSERIVPGYGPPITGSGVLEIQEMDYNDFNSIVVGSAFEVEITGMDPYSVSITMDDNLFEYLKVVQHADTLQIGLQPNRSYIRTKQMATITMPTLHKLELSGASQAEMTGFSSLETMEFDLSGASDLDIMTLNLVM